MIPNEGDSSAPLPPSTDAAAAPEPAEAVHDSTPSGAAFISHGHADAIVAT